MSVETVPAQVRAAVAGQPAAGAWESMYPLLTVDADGYPHVCLLSRAELAADHHRVHAALASRTTIDNLTRRPRATLVVVGERAATYLKLQAVRTEPDERWLGVTFEVASVKHDALDTPLRPPAYEVRTHIALDEDWTRATRLLARLADEHQGGSPCTTG